MIRVRLHYTDTLTMPWAPTEEALAMPRSVVFDGEVDIDGLGSDAADTVWDLFNRVGDGHVEHPALDGLKLRSMCSGDVVEIVEPEHQFWLCKSVGWEPIEGVRSRETR